MEEYAKFIGKSVLLDDFTEIKLVQVKQREDCPWASYYITHYNSIPRKLMMPIDQFKATYPDIFKSKE